MSDSDAHPARLPAHPGLPAIHDWQKRTLRPMTPEEEAKSLPEWRDEYLASGG